MSIVNDLLVAIIVHRAKAKFASFLSEKRLDMFHKRKMTKKEMDAYLREHNKDLECNVKVYCVLERIYKANFGELPDLDKHVNDIFEVLKKGYGWEL